MNSLGDIRMKLGRLKSGPFEELCARLLPKINNEYEGLESTINRDGVATKGPVDGYKRLPDGRYIAFIFTAQQDKIKRKILADIDKAADTSIEIAKIVICLTRPLGIQEDKAFMEAALAKGWEIEIFTLEKLSQALVNFPDLVRDFLSLQLSRPDRKSSPQGEIALEMCLLIDEFKDKFRHIGSSWVLASEAQQLKEGQHIFAVRQQSASETLQKLLDLSRRAKYILDHGELVEEKIDALRCLFNEYSLNLDSYLQSSRTAGEHLRIGVSIPKTVEETRMQLFEKLFGSGRDEFLNSVNKVIQETTELLRKYTAQ
jgi:hypothetical protein